MSGRCAKIFIVVLLVALWTSVNGCSRGEESSEASLQEVSEADFANQSDILGGDEQKDVVFALRVKAGGVITALKISNTNGQSSTWDTVPGNVNWAIGVASSDKPEALLNRADGSVEIPVTEDRPFLLYAADNGSVISGNTDYEITVSLQDGQTKVIPVSR